MVESNDNILEIEQYQKRLSVALKVAKICVFEVDLRLQLYTFFENSEDIFGVKGEQILRDVQPYSKLSPELYQKAVTRYFSHPDDKAVIAEAFSSILQGNPTTYEAQMRASGSQFKWCKIDVSPVMENGMPIKMIGVITDISSIKQQTDLLLQEVQLDNFTGLFNKTYTQLFISEILACRPNSQHALLIIDLDDFKQINDIYGHIIGDEIIRLVAVHLKKNVRQTDIVGRFGGDEYVVFLQNIPSREWLCKKLENLLRFCNTPTPCTMSIGVSITPHDSENLNELFEKADKALYHSKINKGCYTLFSDISMNY